MFPVVFDYRRWFYLKLWCRFRLDPGHCVKRETEPKDADWYPRSVQITLESRVNAMNASEPKIISLSTPVWFQLPFWGEPLFRTSVLPPGLRGLCWIRDPAWYLGCLVYRHHPCLLAFSPPLGNHDSELGFLTGKVKGIEFSAFLITKLQEYFNHLFVHATKRTA